MRTVVKELLSPDGKRKVVIFRRDDGTFGFESVRFTDDSLERSWIPSGRLSECFARDERTAEAEASQAGSIVAGDHDSRD